MNTANHMKVVPVLDYSVRELCKRPYPGHRKGCPNYGKRSSCPPQARLLPDVLNMRRPIAAVWNVFAFGKHVARMRSKHPEWSDPQCRCCLYWQGTARKQLRERVRTFLIFRKERMLAIYTPEACGVNVTATMANIGHYLEWPPETITYQVALVGHRKEC